MARSPLPQKRLWSCRVDLPLAAAVLAIILLVLGYAQGLAVPVRTGTTTLRPTATSRYNYYNTEIAAPSLATNQKIRITTTTALGATPPRSSSSSSSQQQQRYTSLPSGLSPFEKGAAKSRDVAGSFRTLAAKAVDQAMQDKKVRLLEIDFPPFAGTKTQFDDFDNLQELNANRDWCAQLIPLLKRVGSVTHLVLPDDKETELCAKEWTGQLYRKNTQFTSIRAACEANFLGGGANNKSSGGTLKFQKAWGSTLAETFNKLQGGDGILADSSTLDKLSLSDNRLQLICQPGNGGPVEDWINVELLHRAAGPTVTTCIVNGALDKVREGYYPALVFPALAKTVPFYRQCEPVFIVKPISDKGVYGWLFRVYPEPWQVILQTARPGKNGSLQVQETVALISDTRPSYGQIVEALLRQQASLVP